MNPYLDTAPETVVAPKRLPRSRSLQFERVGIVSQILLEVSIRFGVTQPELLSKSRHQSLARARHVAAWLMRQSGMSYPEIGKELGGRDHTTIMHSVRRVEEELVRSPQWRASILEMLGTSVAPSTVWLVPGEGAMLTDYETATGASAGPISSSESKLESA